MTDIVIVDIESRTEVTRFDVANIEPIPQTGDYNWVPENGDIAYWVRGIEHDYAANEVRAMCMEQPDKEQI